MQQEQQNSIVDDIRMTVNLTYVIANTHSLCLTPFIRSSFGLRAMGLSGWFSFVLLVLIAASTPDRGMTVYFYAWIVVVSFQRMRTVSRNRRGQREHSRYGGWPWLAMLVPTINSEHKAKEFEPFMCLAIGLTLMPLSPVVGGFVAAGMLSLGIVQGCHVEARRRTVLSMRDMEIEQNQLRERLRGERNDF